MGLHTQVVWSFIDLCFTIERALKFVFWERVKGELQHLQHCFPSSSITVCPPVLQHNKLLCDHPYSKKVPTITMSRGVLLWSFRYFNVSGLPSFKVLLYLSTRFNEPSNFYWLYIMYYTILVRLCQVIIWAIIDFYTTVSLRISVFEMYHHTHQIILIIIKWFLSICQIYL